MKHRLFRAAALIVFISSAITGVDGGLIVQSNRTAKVSEETLRAIAVNRVMPDYPEESRRQRATGVAVAELLIDEKGEVASVDVLEAPDSIIKEAVLKAVRLWRFKPAKSRNEPISLRGKLTFYYVVEDSNFFVRNPS